MLAYGSIVPIRPGHNIWLNTNGLFGPLFAVKVNAEYSPRFLQAIYPCVNPTTSVKQQRELKPLTAARDNLKLEISFLDSQTDP